jgi:general secretion pathway protein C
MVSRFAAFVIWAAVAASIVFWAMLLWVKPTPVPAHATLVSAADAFNGDLSRLFGSDAEPAAPISGAAPVAAQDARFELIGVVAPLAGADRAEGLALIALDDKPPRAYRVGAAVDGQMVLQSVHARGAALGLPGQAAQLTLELPALPPPATGVPATVGGLPGVSRALPKPPPPPPVLSRPAPPQQFLPQPMPQTTIPSTEEAQDEPPRQPTVPSDGTAPPRRPTVDTTASPGRARPL